MSKRMVIDEPIQVDLIPPAEVVEENIQAEKDKEPSEEE